MEEAEASDKVLQKAAVCPNMFKVGCLGEAGEANICSPQWDVVYFPRGSSSTC